MYNMIIGERLKKLLKIRKISAREFAKMINVSEPMIYKYYKMNRVDSDTLSKWVSALEVPLLYFFSDDDVASNYNKNIEIGDSVYNICQKEHDTIDKQLFHSMLNQKDQEIKELNREIGRLQARIEILEEENSKLKEDK